MRPKDNQTTGDNRSPVPKTMEGEIVSPDVISQPSPIVSQSVPSSVGGEGLRGSVEGDKEEGADGKAHAVEGEVLGPDNTNGLTHVFHPDFEARIWQKGVSGNPGGRPKKDREAIALLKAAEQGAIAKIAHLAENARSEKVQLDAAEYILDRIYGKASQPIDATISGGDTPVSLAFEGVLERWSG